MKRFVLKLLVAASLVLLPMYLQAQDKEPSPKAPAVQEAPAGAMHQHHGGQEMAADQGKDTSKHQEAMAAHCKAMQAKRDQAMKELQAMDLKLDQKIAAMNAAKGDKKMDAMAAVITEMAAQRKEMREKMHSMGGCGMCPMMRHGKGMKDHPPMMGGGMMQKCPMMEKQAGAPEAAPGKEAAPAPKETEQQSKP